MVWIRRVGAMLVVASLLGAFPACGDDGSCDNTIIDTTQPRPRRVLRPAEALVEVTVSDFSRVSDFRISVSLDVTEVLRPGASDHPLAVGPLTVQADDHECGTRSPFLTTDEGSLLVALRWGANGWVPWQVLRENPDGTIEFLSYGGRLNERIDEILDENSINGVIEEMGRG